jgi:hypothetical protein
LFSRFFSIFFDFVFTILIRAGAGLGAVGQRSNHLLLKNLGIKALLNLRKALLYRATEQRWRKPCSCELLELPYGTLWKEM